MLLRRVTEHVKCQNWFAVAIDFGIVVFGVFIGIQVANWNAEQLDRKTSQRLLLRLEQDFSNQRGYLDSLHAKIHDSMLALDAQLSALEAGEPLATELAKKGVAQWMYGELIPPPPASFDEMITTGRLDLIRSPAVRTELQFLKQLAEMTKAVSAQQSATFINTARDLNPYMRRTRAPQLATAQQPLDSLEAATAGVQVFDQVALWKDAKARAALYMHYGMFRNAQVWLQANTRAIDRLLEKIAQDKLPLR